jgi:hypothetical protein
MELASGWLLGGFHCLKQLLINSLVGLYRYGPWWLGCWNYVAPEDICAVLTRSAQLGSLFWVQHRAECDELIRERV